MDKPSCFVVMSFSQDEDTTRAYTDGIQPAVESLGIDCIRVDQTHFTGRITDAILDRLKNAYFIIADLSQERPNCYYELGFAHALGKPVIMLINSKDKIHFDIKDFNFIVYASPAALRSELKERIVGAVLTTHHKGDTDTRNGKFGRLAVRNGRLLTARIMPVNQRLCDVYLQVLRLPGSRPLRGDVYFYLHDTYDPASYRVAANGDVATLEIDAVGAFTVGARVDDRKTELELDLATIPGGNQNFYKQ